MQTHQAQSSARPRRAWGNPINLRLLASGHTIEAGAFGAMLGNSIMQQSQQTGTGQTQVNAVQAENVGVSSAAISQYMSNNLNNAPRLADNSQVVTNPMFVIPTTMSTETAGIFASGSQTVNVQNFGLGYIDTGAACAPLATDPVQALLNTPSVAKGVFPNSWDPIVAQTVSAYNEKWGFVPTDAEYLQPNLAKAMIRVESGSNMNAYTNDPMQVNVGGDWVPEKTQYGLTQGISPGPTLGISAGVDWLSYKAYTYDAQGNPATFRGWDAAVTRYNGGGDPNYLQKVQTQLQNLGQGK